MTIYKFGGASVKDSASVKNVGEIIALSQDKCVIVISAMGKMTNAFESLLNAYVSSDGKVEEKREEIFAFHRNIIEKLFPDRDHHAHTASALLFDEIREITGKAPSDDYDYEYDRLVHYGEVLSSSILSWYLKERGIDNQWLDARQLVVTDSTFRSAAVQWDETERRIEEALSGNQHYYVVQGFIGATPEGMPTTLGREGSDFSAAIFAYCLKAKGVTIWKDVPGILHADPRFYPDAKKLDSLSYHDAIELAYYGAKVIHPKTIKPLQNRMIPLYVKSFVAPQAEGTHISDADSHISSPVFISKRDQVLMTLSPYDFSFITEKNLSEIFFHISTLKIRINMMQNSAISFSLSLDNESKKIDMLVQKLKNSYKILYNDPVELLTIWHYTDETIDRLTCNREVLLEEKSRHTVQMVIRDI